MSFGWFVRDNAEPNLLFFPVGVKFITSHIIYSPHLTPWETLVNVCDLSYRDPVKRIPVLLDIWKWLLMIEYPMFEQKGNPQIFGENKSLYYNFASLQTIHSFYIANIKMNMLVSLECVVSLNQILVELFLKCLVLITL